MLKKSNLLYLCVSLLLIHTISACTIGRPFKSTEALDSMPEDKKVVVGLTHVTLKKNSDTDIFWDNAEAVVESLETQSGFLGHSLRMVVLGNEAWTMTVWKDQESLRSFVGSETHAKAMSEGIEAVEKASFHNFEIEVRNIPPSWEDAEKRLMQSGRSYSY